MTSNQNQNAVAPQVVFFGRQYQDDVTPALLIFVLGWFCCCIWLGGFKFIKSTNQTAKLLGIGSIVAFFLSSIIVIIIIIVYSIAAAAAVSAANNDCNNNNGANC